MFIGTLLIVLAPTAVTIGAAASFIILIARLLQAFSTDGVFGKAVAFLTESAPARKALHASWQVAPQGAAILLAGLFGFVLNNYLSTQSLDGWGWRIPFLFALVAGPVGWYIRTKMDGRPEFLVMKHSESPLKETFTAITPGSGSL
jgi:MHS family proline/betaine transporter-like MFS transporter